jgi:hypothetical protein
MKKLFFIQSEPSGPSWASAQESLTNRCEIFGVNSQDRIITEYDQYVMTYKRQTDLMKLFNTVSDTARFFLSIGIPTEMKNQNLSIEPVNTDIICGALASGKYENIFYAYCHNDHPQGAGRLEIIHKSGYYARNLFTGKLENVKTQQEVNAETPKLSIWYSVTKIQNAEIYYLVTNPNLLDMGNFNDGEHRDIIFQLLNSHDDTFFNELFSPSISGGVQVNDTIIAHSNTIEIDTLGCSMLKRFIEIPDIKLFIETDAEYSTNNNIITLNLPSTKYSYIKYKWHLGNSLDSPKMQRNETMLRSFIILKN